MPGGDEGPLCRFDRPLRIAALVKQIPVGESMALGNDRRLVRHGLELEMNAYCRRAVSKGVEWAELSGGTCTVVTLGPPSADDVLREAIAWGADEGIHLCDLAFGGSDTLATARALAAALEQFGPFDLVLVGRNSLDGDTGQVGPEIAELVQLPFAAGVRVMAIDGGTLSLTLEQDDGWEDVEMSLPAVLSVAERLCEPCKVPPDRRSEVPASRIRGVHASQLGPGPWGQAGSPTVVGETRTFAHNRGGKVLTGPVGDQVAEAVALLAERGALVTPPDGGGGVPLPQHEARPEGGPIIAVLVEPGRTQVGAEMLGAASALASASAGRVHALALPGEDPVALGSAGADDVTMFMGAAVAEDVAAGIVQWSAHRRVAAVLGPSTAFGREVLARVAAAQGFGLVGDAIGVSFVDGHVVAAKPAFSGALVADISCRSPVTLVSIRPGVLAVPPHRLHTPRVDEWPVTPRGRVRVLSSRRDDDIEVLARAQVVIGVGAAVAPGEYAEIAPLAKLLGAELAASRKVTDNGWAPRSRQVGITGRSIAPRLYVALGVSGKFNHMVGVRAAGTVLAINKDAGALVFSHCDLGIVGDWHEVVRSLTVALRLMEPVGS
ncbi:MAG TPA: FAD-binding protein [Acidimicrobiales bacterium]|nr:FAD-binding protein [Acidimicrobiales bacterium]